MGKEGWRERSNGGRERGRRRNISLKIFYAIFRRNSLPIILLHVLNICNKKKENYMQELE